MWWRVITLDKEHHLKLFREATRKHCPGMV